MLNLILWIFLAFAFGLILFFSIQDKIPDELYFLKNQGSARTSAASASEPGQRGGEYEGWSVRQVGAVVEITKSLRKVGTEPKSNGVDISHRNPTLGILCDNGRLDVRVDAAGPTTGRTQTAVGMSIQLQRDWDKGQGTNIFPKDPHALLRGLQTQPVVAFELSYIDAGAVKVAVETKGLAELVQRLPATCQ